VTTEEILAVARRTAPAARVTWRERDVQDSLYVHCAIKNHEIVVPNSQVFGWETDLVGVTRTGYIHEFEIKCSRADFKCDGKKARSRLLIDPVRRNYTGGEFTHPRPNYFWYAVPDGLVAAEEVPDYAGLLYVMRRAECRRGQIPLYYGTVVVVKEAARLHKTKIDEWQRRQLARSMTVRFWRQRISAGAGDKRLDSE
jgi:hypothetical protein